MNLSWKFLPSIKLQRFLNIFSDELVKYAKEMDVLKTSQITDTRSKQVILETKIPVPVQVKRLKISLFIFIY